MAVCTTPVATQEHQEAATSHSTDAYEERLVAITDEGVTVFSFPSLSLKAQAFRSKDALALRWTDELQLLAVARSGGLGKPNQYDSLWTLACLCAYHLHVRLRVPLCCAAHPIQMIRCVCRLITSPASFCPMACSNGGDAGNSVRPLVRQPVQ